MARPSSNAPSGKGPGVTVRNLSQADAAMPLANNLIDMARFEPNEFQKKILGLKPDPWQEPATDAVFDVVRKRYGKPTLYNHEGKRYFTVRAMHGPGKTFWLASLIYTFALAFPKSRIPCVAPKLDQLKTRLWFELRKIKDTIHPHLRDAVDVQATTVKFFGVDEWLAFAQTAKRAENLAGLHHDFLLLPVDEASGVEEALYPVIFGAVSTGKVVILVLISNPTKNTGTFAESWLKPDIAKGFYQIPITLDQAPRVDKSWVEAMRTKYGEKSPIFRIRCLGEFADAGERQLIPLQHILDAFVHERSEGDGSHPRLRVAVDVADGGLDETVVTAVRYWDSYEELQHMRRFSFPSSESPIRSAEAAEQIFYALGGIKGRDEFVVDALGVGAGTAGTLIDRGHAVVAYQGGASSDDVTRWRNRRSQSYINLRDAFRDGRLRLWTGAFESDEDREDFVAQLCIIETKPGVDRVEELITKRELMLKGVKSPDIADSLAMQYATQQPTLGQRQGLASQIADAIYVAPLTALDGYLG